MHAEADVEKEKMINKIRIKRICPRKALRIRANVTRGIVVPMNTAANKLCNNLRGLTIEHQIPH